MFKRKVGSQSVNLTPNHKKLGIALNYVHAGGMSHIFGKLSIKNTIFFKARVNKRSTQEVISLQSGGNNIIRGKVVVSSSPSCGESYEFVYARGLFVHQKCSNYALTNLLFGLCRSIWIIDSLVTRLNPHLGDLNIPFTPEVLQARKCTPTLFSSIIFTLGFAFESFKEFGSASLNHISTRPSIKP